MIFATAGSKLYIGGPLEQKSGDFVQADFASQSSAWVEITGLESLGSIGDAAEAIETTLIGEARVKRIKGARSAGTMEVVAAADYADPGQIAAIAAEKTNHDHAFRLVFNDAPPGGTPSERMFIAQVGSANETLDTANNVVKLNLSLWVNSNVVRIAATAG